MAFPTLQQLQNDGVLSALVTTDMHDDVVAQARAFSSQYGRPLHILAHSRFKEQLKQILDDGQPDAVIVMTFPWRIPAALLAMPRLGFFNIHPGKLPEMRGADPVFECIRRQMPEAGCTIHVMTDEIDKGTIVAQQYVPVTPELTHGMLCGRMAYLAAQLCTDLIKDIKEDRMPASLPQDESRARYWPKAGAEELRIRWDEMDLEEIAALVRSCNPVTKGIPVTINGWQIGVYDVSAVNLEGDTSHLRPGTVITADMQNGLLIYCRNGKALKLEVFYSEEGVMPGYKLAFYGIGPGSVFN